MTLSEQQESRLLRLYLCGDPFGGRWSTMAALIRMGLVREDAERRTLVVTDAGKAYCDRRHARATGSCEFCPAQGGGCAGCE